MAHIFQTFRKRRDPDTGKRIPVLDAKGKPIPHARWRGEYVDWRGQRHVVTLTTNRKDSEAMLERMALKHHEIRIGHRPAPTLADKAARRLFSEVAAEYVAWGKTQGGRRGRPWSRGHAHMRQTHLKYWAEQLSCEMLSDLTGCLPQVERAIQAMRQERLTGKTIANKIEALRSFCLWAMDRDLLAENPLRKLARVDTTPQTNRRDLEPEEIARLLPVCELHRRILYITAIGTGFRANELQMLTPADLNPSNNTIHLAAEYDKARIERFQPVCDELMDLLVNYVKTGEAARLYRERERHTRDGVKPLPHPTEPLLYVPQNTAELLAGDLRRAGIEVTTANGKVDFHALRVTGITLASMATPDVDVVRIFARHASLAVTQGYIKTRLGRVIGVVERVGEQVIAPLAAMFGNGISTERGKTTETNKGATGLISAGCALFGVASPTGLEPVFSD